MKKQLLTAFIALVAFSAQAQWINQNVPFGYEGYINDIRITDVNTVWGNTWDALATSPYTNDWVRTIDGGNTWTAGSVSAPAQYVISNIWPIDADTCYVSMYNTGGAGGAEYKTTDGGATWSQVGSNMFQAATSFADVTYFWDAQNGMAMGDPIGNPLKYEIWLTNDYGNTWTQVPPANLPTLTNAAEYGITNLFDAADGRVWFATTYGDVYRTIDGGNTWTKSASGFPAYTPPSTTARQDISNIAFSDSTHGLIMQVRADSSIIHLKSTNDGGLTWSDVTTSGTLFGGDICGVPHTTGTFVSSGSNNTFGFGTSFTLDNGLTWNEISTNVSHTAIDFLDTLTGWSGEYIQTLPGGAWKFTGALATITCSNPNINSGIVTLGDTSVCFADSVSISTADVLAPTEGTVHGFSILISTVDISGNSDPMSTGAIAAGFQVMQGAPPTLYVKNDQTVLQLPGVYYFTPLVFGNAVDNVGQNWSFDLTYDPNCTYTGTSVPVNFLDFGDPQCIDDGIINLGLPSLSVKVYQASPDLLNVRINAVKGDNNTSIRIFDLTGRTAFEDNYSVVKGINNISINASSLSAGTYLLQTISGGAVVTEKLVKM